MAVIFVAYGMPSSMQAAKAYAAASDKAPTILTYGITTDPDHLNPFQATSADSRIILFNIFDGLLKPTVEGKLIPAIAESYEISDDLKSYTFVLRDAVFHNGEKITVQDVRYSIAQAIKYKMTGMNAIASTEIIDDETIIINLRHPDSEFYYSMTTAIVPKDYDLHNLKPIGAGPFKFVSYSPQQELVLAKHTGYWNPELPKVDKVIFKIKSDMNTILLDLRAGSLDAATINTTLATQLNPDYFEIIYENTNAVQTLCLNNAFEPLNNILVRQAISYAVSATDIRLLAHSGHAVRSGSPVIPALRTGHNFDVDKAYAKNIDLAKELLTQAGYPDGFTLSFTVPSAYQQHVDTAQVIVNQLAEININAKIEQVDWPTWLNRVYVNRDYEMTIVSVDGVTLSPRSYLFRYETNSSGNFINYSNLEYDTLFKKALTTSDTSARTAIYHQLQKLLSDDAASVFICDIASPKVFKKGIKGFAAYPIYILDASTLYFE